MTLNIRRTTFNHIGSRILDKTQFIKTKTVQNMVLTHTQKFLFERKTHLHFTATINHGQAFFSSDIVELYHKIYCKSSIFTVQKQ